MADEANDTLSELPTNGTVPKMARSNSISAASEDSHTAQDFINSQLQLEADAREVMPYQFDSCTRPLGPLRQTLFSCLTCNPPRANTSDPYTPAGVCYSCSISCHGEHELVELFSKRNFVCDCGTTRLPESAPCSLRLNEKTGVKGCVTGETPVEGNRYNHNFANRFCGCDEPYNPHQEKGTMFQCLGLGTVEEGGCGEDWWHPECIMGLPRDWHKKTALKKEAKDNGEQSGPNADESATQPQAAEAAAPEHPVPPGFPDEDDFEYFLCYKCVDANPWVKRYAGSPGFLSAAFQQAPPTAQAKTQPEQAAEVAQASSESASKKRTRENEGADEAGDQLKRQRTITDVSTNDTTTINAPTSSGTTQTDASAARVCTYSILPPAPSSRLSLFLKDDFRERICRCPECFPRLRPFPQLLEEEDTYEPPMSDDGDADGAPSVGTGSLLDRGEAALSNMDRVRAIEGVMVYNHLKDKVKSFLQPFAESGQAVGAEDIKAYFEKLRGDAEGMKQAAAGAAGDGNGDGDNRREQSGY